MYSLSQIRDAIDKEPLSDALYKMEQFARSNNLVDLAEWSKRELHGYDGQDKEEEKIKDYRTIAVQWLDIYHRPLKIDPSLSFIGSLPLWAGVSKIEDFASKGTGYDFPGAIELINGISQVPVSCAWLPPEQIQSWLKSIRLQARIRLDEKVPYILKTNVPSAEYERKWTWQQRAATFFSIFGGTWIMLEPLFAVFGGSGPFADWGAWRYALLLGFASAVTLFIELITQKKSRD